MDLKDQPDDFDRRYPRSDIRPSVPPVAKPLPSDGTLSGIERPLLSPEGADEIDKALIRREGEARKAFTLEARGNGGVDAALRAFTSLFAMVQKAVHANNISKGWWKKRMIEIAPPGERARIVPDRGEIGELLMLVNTELCEGMEAHRNHNPADKHLPHRNSLEVELADAVIRIMDIGEAYGLDVAGAIIDKAKFNESRAHKHGGKAC